MAEWTVMLHDKIIKRFTIGEGERLTIGRGKEADVVIDNTAISRLHVALELRDGVYFLSDLESLNGTYVNRKQVGSHEPVSPLDTIEFGKFKLAMAEFVESDDPVMTSSTATPHMDMEDATVFVSQPKGPKPKAQFHPKSDTHRLSLVEGDLVPTALSLEGKNSVKIGTDPSSDLRLSGWFIAKAQCYIIRREQKFYLVPQASWVSTFVNDQKVKSEHLLLPGDLIKVRRTIIRFD